MCPLKPKEEHSVFIKSKKQCICNQVSAANLCNDIIQLALRMAIQIVTSANTTCVNKSGIGMNKNICVQGKQMCQQVSGV